MASIIAMHSQGNSLQGLSGPPVGFEAYSKHGPLASGGLSP